MGGKGNEGGMRRVRERKSDVLVLVQLGIHDAFRLCVAGEATGVSSGAVEGVPQREQQRAGGKGRAAGGKGKSVSAQMRAYNTLLLRELQLQLKRSSDSTLLRRSLFTPAVLSAAVSFFILQTCCCGRVDGSCSVEESRVSPRRHVARPTRLL